MGDSIKVRFIQDADRYANGVVQQRPIWRKPDQIVKIQLQRVIDRLAKQNIHLSVTDNTTRYLADAGFDPVFGARPLKRAIQKHLLDPLSLAVLEGGFKDGDHITAVRKGGKIIFSKV